MHSLNPQSQIPNPGKEPDKVDIFTSSNLFTFHSPLPPCAYLPLITDFHCYCFFVFPCLLLSCNSILKFHLSADSSYEYEHDGSEVQKLLAKF